MADTKIKLIVNDDGTIKVVGDLQDKFKGLGEEADKSSQRATRAMDALKTAGIATAAAVGAALTATTVAVGRQFQQIDELAKVSRATGVAVKDLSGLQVAADLAGVSLQGLGTSLGIFSRKIAEAQSGGRARGIFDALGIDVNSSRSTQSLLEDVADRFAVLGEGAETTALAMDLFGRSGARLINLLGGGGEAIRAAREEAALFGLVVDKDVSDAVEQVNDDLSRLSSLSVGFARDLVEATAPALAEVSKEAVAWAAANREVIAQDFGGYLTNLVPVIRTVADGFIFANSMLDEFATGIGNLIGAGNVYASSEIAQQVARRLQARGLRSGDLGDMPGLMTAADGSGAVAAEVADVARGEEKITDTVRDRAELIERIRNAMRDAAGGAAGGGAGGGSGGYGPGTMPLPFVGAIEAARGEIELMAAEAALVPGVVQDWTQEFERAEAAAISLGDMFADSLTSVIDSLLARDGGFDLEDVLSGLGRRAMAEMVGSMLKEKLKFDVAFQENFLGFLPRIASQGGELIAQGFGRGLSDVSSQAANLGSVINGSLRVNGLGVFGDTGGGMSVDSMNNGFQSNMDGTVSLMSGGAPLAQGAAGVAEAGGIFGSLSGALGGLGLLAGAAGLATGLFGLLDRGPGVAELGRRNIRDIFRNASLVRGMALQEPDYRLVTGERPGDRTRYNTAQLIDFNRLGTPIFAEGDPRLAGVYALAALTQDDPTKLSRSQFGSFLSDVPLRAGQLGVSESYFRAELGLLAGGIDPVQAIINLNAGRMQNSGGRLSQYEYGAGVQGILELLQDGGSIPRGVDAVSIAFRNLEETTRGTIVNFKAFGHELERQTQVAGGVSSGITGAFGSAATGILGRSDTAGKDFAAAIFDTAVGGIGQNLLTSLFADGGVLANFEASFVEAILGGDPAAIEAIMSKTPEMFGLINERLAEFLPVLDKFRQEVEDATGATAQGFRDQRSDLKARIRDAKMATMTPMEQEAEYLRQIGADRGILGGLLEDGQITEDERGQFNKVNPRLIENSFALLGLRGNYAEGSVQQRRIDSTAFGALELADTALEIAASSIVVGDMSVTRQDTETMYVDKIIISATAAQSLVGG